MICQQKSRVAGFGGMEKVAWGAIKGLFVLLFIAISSNYLERFQIKRRPRLN
jgi:hypothetical protein